MNNSLWILVAIAYSVGVYVVGYDIGKGTVKETVKTEVSNEVEKEKDHKTTTITKTKDKQGNAKTVTIISEDVDKTIVKDETVSQRTQEAAREQRYRLYGISSWEIRNDFRSSYGIGGSAKVIGPVEIGAFYLTNGTVGATVGVSF